MIQIIRVLLVDVDDRVVLHGNDAVTLGDGNVDDPARLVDIGEALSVAGETLTLLGNFDGEIQISLVKLLVAGRIVSEDLLLFNAAIFETLIHFGRRSSRSRIISEYLIDSGR